MNLRLTLETIRDVAIQGLSELPRESRVPLTYPKLRSDREVVPAVQLATDFAQAIPAGFTGVQVARVTSPRVSSKSCTTPSSSHVSAWSADSQHYYVRTVPGEYIVFTREGQEVARPGFTFEPTFSLVRPGVLIGIGKGGSVVCEYDLGTKTLRDVLDLKMLPGWPLGEAYAGTLVASAAPERIAVIYGGRGQDLHTKCVVYDVEAHDWQIVDSMMQALGFKIHGMALDKSGQYLALYPTAADLRQGKSIGYLHDLNGPDDRRWLPLEPWAHGHAAYGFNCYVNQSGDGGGPYDAYQWKYRTLNDPATWRNLIPQVLRPALVQGGDHSCYHNAQPDVQVPFCTATYRKDAPIDPCPRRAWDDEVLMVATDGSGSVWRVGPHYSITERANGSLIYWATPRPQISPDGLSIISTSNLMGTLGADTSDGELGGMRCDVLKYDLEV